MTLFGIVRILAFMAVLAVMGVTAWAVWKVREEVFEPKQTDEQLAALLAEKEVAPEIDPGKRVFDRAAELIALGRVEEGREKLLYVVNFYPDSPVAPEAKRILGEMNLDDLLSTENMEGKSVCTVKPGDSFLGIAARYQTTLDCLMLLNGLKGFDRLHPGDKLVVMPLNFRVLIDPNRRTLTLWDKGRFLKEYRLLACDPGRLGHGAKTKIKGKTGILGDKRVPPSSKDYRGSDKVLGLAAGGLAIRAMPEDGSASGAGFFLSRPDMEELALLLRVGNEVEIRPVFR